jgi:branched-chain amino acid transport system substrate-binding protein
MQLVPRRRVPAAFILSIALATLAASCGGGDDENTDAVQALPSSSCADVEYGGDGEPDALIASDLPMQGDSKARSEQMVEAIRLALEHRHWRAGDVSVAFQACDDSVAKTGLWDAKKCRANAEAYADDPDVIGVIGTYNSGCAAEIMPILNRAKGGPVPMVSPGNTLVCLTEPADSCAAGEPAKYAPSGKRSYARVVPNDAFQGAALAKFVEDRGDSRPFVLYAAKDPTSLGQADTFRNSARALGLDEAGFEAWNPNAKDYADLMAEVKRADPDTVVLAGLIEQNGGQLIEDKVKSLGPNDGDVSLIAFDGFAQQATIDEAGKASAGMFAGVPGRAPENLKSAGQEFVKQLSDRVDGEVELYAPYAGESADVLLGAIRRAGDDRAAIVNALFETRRRNGILGSYDIEPTGDPSVGPVTIFEADGTFEPSTEIAPPASLAAAARGD